jgi:hypothetical protein
MLVRGSRSKLGGGGGWMTCSIDLGALTLAVLAEVAAHAGAF